jgi:hypothetical protein
MGLFIKDKDKFINDVVETRNYLTHYSKGKEELSPIKHHYELVRLINNLRTIIEFCLLKEVGFSSEEIKNLFLKTIICF